MGKTIDRYILGKFVVLFVGFFVASMGLFAVVDGFTNLDEFQQKTVGEGSLSLLVFMARNYAIRSAWILDLIGPTLATMSAVAVLALLVRHGEINPLLAAGVPTYRLAVPLLMGMAMVHGLLAINKELLLPRIAPHLAGDHGSDGNDAHQVQPARDALGIFISGRELIPATGILRGAEFRISRSPLVKSYTYLHAEEAKFFRGAGEGKPAGWLLKDARPEVSELSLTELGRKKIYPVKDSSDLFVTTDVSWDQLQDQGTGSHYLSTADLIKRVRRPALGSPLLREQVLQLHSRFTRPFMNIIGLFLAIPLIIRRESRSLVTNIAVCMAALAVVVGMTEAFQILGGKAALVSAERATWIPLIAGGGFCAWVSPRVQT